jgi:predicted pyridoxine 5'-phosphate oxidase superfamily flavin-nucleotide-binding protein
MNKGQDSEEGRAVKNGYSGKNVIKFGGKMAKITQDMKDIAEQAVIFIAATASKDGKPNGVPIGLTRIISDDEIMLFDNFMHKTRQNIAENPVVAITFWAKEARYGYQCKGPARVETAGNHFDEAIQWLQSKGRNFQPKAVVIVKVEEIYYVGARKDSSIRLDQMDTE